MPTFRCGGRSRRFARRCSSRGRAGLGRRARAPERRGAPRSRDRRRGAAVRQCRARSSRRCSSMRGRTTGRTDPFARGAYSYPLVGGSKAGRRSRGRFAARSTSRARRRSTNRTAARCTARFEAGAARRRSLRAIWARSKCTRARSTRCDGFSPSRCSSRSCSTDARSTGPPRGPRFAPHPGRFC